MAGRALTGPLVFDDNPAGDGVESWAAGIVLVIKAFICANPKG